MASCNTFAPSSALNLAGFGILMRSGLDTINICPIVDELLCM